jgi:hypothetical protein
MGNYSTHLTLSGEQCRTVRILELENEFDGAFEDALSKCGEKSFELETDRDRKLTSLTAQAGLGWVACLGIL